MKTSSIFTFNANFLQMFKLACWLLRYKLLQLNLVASFARVICMQPARLGQRPTLVNTQGSIRLRHACYVTVAGQCAAAASQLACGRTDRPEVTAPHFWKNVVIFVRTTPIDIKPSTCPAHGCYASECQISPSYDAAFRRR